MEELPNDLRYRIGEHLNLVWSADSDLLETRCEELLAFAVKNDRTGQLRTVLEFKQNRKRVPIPMRYKLGRLFPDREHLGYIAFLWAVQLGHVKCLRLLLEFSCLVHRNIPMPDKKDKCMIHYVNESIPLHAMKNGHVECLRLLILANYQLNNKPSLWASKNGHAEGLLLLIESNCPIHESAAENAAKNGHTECLRLLIQAGYPISQADAKTS